MPQIKREIRLINNIKKLKCSKCKYWLAFDEFDNDNKTSTGKKSYCKVCRKSKYDKQRIKTTNSCVKGLYLYQCPQCKTKFTTKKSNKVFCSNKCKKRNWYLKNFFKGY